MKYIFPAIFSKEDKGYSVIFPDLPNCFTQGESLQNALDMAEDALCLTLYHMEKDKKEIPDPSDINTIICKDNEFTTLINCNTFEYEKFYKSKAVKKTLTIPEWLNDMAISENINFSNVLQNALIEQLNIAER